MGPEAEEKPNPIPSVQSQSTLSSLTTVEESPSPPDEAAQNPVAVTFGSDDPANPHNWSTVKKIRIVSTMVLISANSTLGSALAANLAPYLRATMDVPAGPQTILPTSVYLTGFIFGPLIFAPLSESYGRKPVLLIGFVLFTLSALGTALAPTWPAFLVFRFLTGTFGSPPLSVGGGVIADVFSHEVIRGRVMMAWGAATFMGPLGAPIISGFIGPVAWRWAFWIAFILAAVSFISVVVLPETLALKILRKKAARLNKGSGNMGEMYISPGDLQRGSLRVSLATTLSRPMRLLFTEMLLALSCAYMAFAYAVFYMSLKIFAAIFQGVYGFTPGLSGVAFTTVGLGTIAACLGCLWYDKVAPGLAAKHPEKRAEYLRLPIACVAGPVFVVSLLWLGWSSSPGIHWVAPLLAAIPYGFAYQMIFNAMLMYVTDAYPIYAASALATCSTTRSMAGALIPLGMDNMLDSLGIAWSCTVLAIVSAVLSFVPFGFIAYGDKISGASRLSATIKPQAVPNDGELTRSLSAA
ncbi:major facilitator superfamily domain-containing protein [Apodospora peruviana]|uniref:Major facilitator superfamily domain-containing protein n=1 Tax=Apodospora peruviana TaxID=516989 RepID=A0AAE0IJR6_9PEZI|nr:major facilitator superfamily domain-containing protein [Apodospora peruviana]